MICFNFTRLTIGFILLVAVFKCNGYSMTDVSTLRTLYLVKYTDMRNELASSNSKRFKCITKCIVRESRQVGIDMKIISGPLEHTTILPVATTQKSVKKLVPPYTPFVIQGMALQGLKNCGKDKCKLGERKQNNEDKLEETFELLKICNNKMYYLTKASVDVAIRTKVCCDFNFLPAQIESRDELDCIRSYYNKIEGNGKAVKAFTAYWDTTLTRKFESCASRKVMPQELWADGQPDNVGGNEICTAVNLCSDCPYVGMQDVPCLVPIPVLCYKNVTAGQSQSQTLTKRTIPTYDPVVQSALRLSGAYNCSGTITSCTMKTVSEKTFNQQATLLKQCGSKLFYMTTAKNAPTQNSFQICCDINLWPAEFDTKDEMNCLMEHFKNVTNQPVEVDLKTSYFDATFTRKFESCATRRVLSDVLWAVNEPDNKKGKEFCVVLKLCTTCKNPGLYDTDCTSPHNLLCYKNLKSESKLSVTETTTSPPKVIPTYEPFGQKVLVSYGFYNCSGKTYGCKPKKVTEEEILKKFQPLKKCNDKSYYVSNFKISARDGIIQSCCNYNMFPADIENVEEMECLQRNYLDISKSDKELYSFTDFLDTTFTRKFESCLTRRVMSDELWAPREPNNFDGIEYCAALKLCRTCKNAGIHDIPCVLPQPVLCFSKQNNVKLSITETTTSTPKVIPTYEPFGQKVLVSYGFYNCSGKTYGCKLKKVTEEEILKKFQPLKKCNKKSYYVSNFKISARDGIIQSCCNFNMFPADIENVEEMECLQKNYLDISKSDKELYSFTDFLDTTFTRKFESCLTRRVMSDELWAPREPNNFDGIEYCAALKLCRTCKNAGIHDIPCVLPQPILCFSKQNNVKEQITTAPPKTKTFYNALLLQGLLMQKIQNCTGQDAKCIKKTVSTETLEQNMEFLGVCGQKSYYITRIVTKRSYHACCNFNLQPAEFESKMEMNCIRRLYKYIPGEGLDVKLYTAYWDATFTRKFESCLTRRPMPDELWSKDEPNNKLNVEYCAVLRPCASCEYAGFDDVDCTEMLPMLCQKYNEL